MNLTWIENARREFIRVYGAKRGPAVCDAVIPGVLGDFRRMLSRAAEGELIREDYRTDDLRADIHLEGRREGDLLLVTVLTVGGQAVPLGAPSVRI